MPAPTARDRTRCIKVQARLTARVPHLEILVAALLGEDWLTTVNAARAAEGRREYRAGAADERAALALFAHTPQVRDRWAPAARAASQLGGILNAAHHNDAERWQKGDAQRAEELCAQLEAFLDAHPVDAVASSWTVTVELGRLAKRQRKPAVEASATREAGAGESVTGVAEAAVAELAAAADWPLARALPAIATAASTDPAAAGHLRVELRRPDGEQTQTLALTARRSDATGGPFEVLVQH